ncbi:MAG: CHAT domain-containing protein [Gammaproteobacteria bacterium]
MLRHLPLKSPMTALPAIASQRAPTRARGLLAIGILLFGALTQVDAATPGPNEGAPSDSNAPARAPDQAALKRGCSRNWAATVSHARTMEGGTGRLWLNVQASARLTNALAAIGYATGKPSEQEMLAREALADVDCGAVPEDGTRIFHLMLARAEALQVLQRAGEAESLLRAANERVRRKPPNRAELLTEGLRALAECLESESKFEAAERVRDELLALEGKSSGERGGVLVEQNIEIAMGSRVSLDELVGLGRYEDAELSARYWLDRADRRGVREDSLTASILLRLAGVLNTQDKYATAESFLRRLDRIELGAERNEWRRNARGAWIRSLSGQRRFAEAQELAMRDVDEARAAGPSERLIEAHAHLGDLLAAQERWPEAERPYREAIALFEKVRAAESLYTQVAYSLATTLRFRGRYAEADTLLREVIQSDAKSAGIVNGQLPADFFGAAGQARFAFGASAPSFINYARDLTARGAVLTGLGRPREARALLERALDISARQLTAESALDPDGAARDARTSREYTVRYLVPALWADAGAPGAAPASARSALEQAFELAQYGAQHAAGAALVWAGVRSLAASQGSGEDVRERESLRAQLEALDREDVLAHARGGTASLEAHLRAKRRLESARADVRANAKKLRGSFPRLWDLADPAPVGVAELQGRDRSASALLHSDEALVLILQSTAGVFVFAISSTDAAWSRAPISDRDLNAAVTRLRCGIEVNSCRDDTRGPRGFDRSLAHRLYATLLGDAAIARVLRPRHTLLISGNGAITSLPFGLLLTAPPSGADGDARNLRDSPWLVRRNATTVIPSVASLRTLRRIVPSIAGEAREPFLGFAPSFGGGGEDRAAPGPIESYFSDERPRLERLRRLPALSGANEVSSLGVLLGAPDDAVFVGERATKEKVMALNAQGRLMRAKVIAFATHALVSGEYGLAEPALAMALPPENAAPTVEDDEGLLKASDIVGLRLQADWVLLSACNTGAGETPEAEGLTGLARAFLFAGARALLVSHWAVDDEVARRLVTRTFKLLPSEGGLSRAEALRRAELELLDDPDRDEERVSNADPRVWAPFIVVGTD